MAMADTVAWLCYADDMRLVELKQMAQEAPGAHPECVGGKGRAGGAIVRQGGVQGNHGGAMVISGGDPATAVDKMVNQPGTKHHGHRG